MSNKLSKLKLKIQKQEKQLQNDKMRLAILSNASNQMCSKTLMTLPTDIRVIIYYKLILDEIALGNFSRIIKYVETKAFWKNRKDVFKILLVNENWQKFIRMTVCRQSKNIMLKVLPSLTDKTKSYFIIKLYWYAGNFDYMYKITMSIVKIWIIVTCTLLEKLP